MFNLLILASYCVLLIGFSQEFTRGWLVPTEGPICTFQQQHCQHATFALCYLLWLLIKIQTKIKIFFSFSNVLTYTSGMKTIIINYSPLSRQDICTRDGISCRFFKTPSWNEEQISKWGNARDLSIFCSLHV